MLCIRIGLGLFQIKTYIYLIVIFLCMNIQLKNHKIYNCVNFQHLTNPKSEFKKNIWDLSFNSPLCKYKKVSSVISYSISFLVFVELKFLEFLYLMLPSDFPWREVVKSVVEFDRLCSWGFKLCAILHFYSTCIYALLDSFNFWPGISFTEFIAPIKLRWIGSL